MGARADDGAAFAVILGFLAVVAELHIASGFGQRDSHCRHQRNAFVGRAEQHVKRHIGRGNCFGVKLRELPQRVAVAEQPRVEEVRRQAPGLGLELAEQQHARVDGEADEVVSETGSHD